MADLEMIEVGTNMNGDSVYNVKKKDGGLVSTTIYTQAEALDVINAAEDKFEHVETVTVETTSEPSYEDMSKTQLESLMRNHGVELDRRESKKALVKKVEKFFKNIRGLVE